ncbi:MAG TPA: efflux RND transporter permease subunit [bacterium]|jgi:CzcA family heavy metal efflux pump
MSPFEYALRHRKAVLFLLIALVSCGAAVTLKMPVSLFPDITFPRIVILADNGEQPAERMMTEVTKPLEEVASSLPGVNVVRSITSRGSSEISILLTWKANVQQTLQLLQGRISNIRNQLPATAAIQAEQMSVAVFPIQGYSLTSDTLSLVELRDLALYQIRPALMRVSGAARIEVTGGDTREFTVVLAPDRMAAYHISAPQVTDAINKANSVVSAGLVDNNHQLYLSLVSGLLKTTDDVASVVVSAQNGVPILVRDVADVQIAVADNYIRTTAHGHNAVLINIIKQPTGSTVQIGKDVTNRLKTLNLPAGVHFENFYDQSDFISGSITSTRDAILIGILLAMAVMFLFLRSSRIMLVIVLFVPSVISVSLVVLYLLGETINIMTLGGIAAAVGLIIDDAIVVIEHAFARYPREGNVKEARRTFRETSASATRELMPAIIGSTLCTIVIFIPLGFLSGITGAFFKSLSITMVIALAVSFLFSISLAPLFASLFVREKDIRHEVAKGSHASRISGWYERSLNRLLRFRWTVLAGAVLIAAATYFLYKGIGSDFMPEMDEGSFVLDYSSPPGTSLDETNRMLTSVEHILMAIPEVAAYSRRTGTQLGFFITEPNTGDFLVKLKKKRNRDINTIIDEAREKIESSQPALRIDIFQLMADVIGDLTNSPSPIEIKLFGGSPQIMQQMAEQITQQIETVPGVVDAFNGIVISGPSMIVRVDPIKAARYGFNATDIGDQIETIMQGTTESTIQSGEKLIGIHVRYPSAYRTDMESIESLSLINPNGIAVPLKNIASVERTAGQAELDREGLRQVVAVTARVSGRDLGGTIRDIQAKLQSNLVLPKGVTLEYGGVYQTQQESFRGLLIVAAAAILLVFMVLLFEFGEFAVPLSILPITLLALFGSFAALRLTGVTFNISSFVGVIMIVGIVAENAVFVMHTIKQRQAQGDDLDTAIVRASLVRTRPILMTTLAAILALLPLALGLGSGSQMQQPLAIAVIGGFSVSSLLLFFGLPMLYRLSKRS